jgi:hypothetical protein
LDNATSGAPELIAGEDRVGGVNGAKETLPPAELALCGRGGELQDLTYLSVDQANGGLSWMNGCGNTATVQRERDSILTAPILKSDLYLQETEHLQPTAIISPHQLNAHFASQMVDTSNTLTVPPVSYLAVSLFCVNAHEWICLSVFSSLSHIQYQEKDQLVLSCCPVKRRFFLQEKIDNLRSKGHESSCYGPMHGVKK